MWGSIWRAVAVTAVVVLGACGGGGGGADTPVPVSTNKVPTATILAAGDVRTSPVGTGVALTLGGTVRLDASTSSDPDRDTLSYEWQLTTRPDSSTLVLPAITSANLELKPDALGSYVFSLKVTDPKGASNTQQLTVLVDNRAPTGVVLVTPQFTPVPSVGATQAVTVGSTVLVDGSGSTDPDGDALALTFEWAERPSGSTAALTLSGKQARFVVDLPGRYQLRVHGSDGKQGRFETLHVFDANNQAPTAVMLTNVSAVTLDGGETTLPLSLGYELRLDASTSRDADGDSLSHAWKLLSQPAGGTLGLTADNGAVTAITPDRLGDYLVELTTTDAKGAKGVKRLRVQVNNRRPVAEIGSNAFPNALAAAPSLRLPMGTKLTLRGSLSSDADGDTLTYAWRIEERPASSVAALSSDSVADPTFTPDLVGRYLMRLRVTDAKGAWSERTVALEIGDAAPVAVVDRSHVSQLTGQAISVSAALSFDADGDTLSYSWSLDAQPSGSTATLAGPTTGATMQFTPDLPGSYVLAVTVRDARSASIAYVSVRALANLVNSVELTVKPLHVQYSRGLDKVVLTSGNPNSLQIIDPFTGGRTQLALPTSARRLQLSPDGRLAAVLHEGSVSLVDLATSSLLRTSSSAGQQTDAFVTNSGFIYLIGQSGGQWVDQPVTVINGRDGSTVPQGLAYGQGTFYGTQYGVLAGSLNRFFLMSLGLSPADITYVQFNPSTNVMARAGESPYHGDYSMSAPLFLTENQSLLVTAVGTYFRTDDLRYAGRLEGLTQITTFSHWDAGQEALVVSPPGSPEWWATPSKRSASYLRFTGSLLLPDGSLASPTINGSASYAIAAFHSGSGRHVLLVQTGSDDIDAPSARYHIALR